jgi:mycothiol synthase
MPPGYEVRPPTSEDIDAIAAVLLADDLDDTGQPVLDADFVREQWSRGGFEPSTDGWVVLDGGGTIVGYGHVASDEPGIVESWGVVHPDHRGRGIGAALFAQIEERAARLTDPPPQRFRHAANAGDRAAAALMTSAGLRTVRHFWHMQIDPEAPFDPGPAPDGIAIGGIDPGVDLPALHAILVEAFADDWGYHPEPFDRWAEGYANGPSYDPSLWLLARDDGKPVGALTANVFGDRGWVGELGVVTSHRGRGIGAALLRRSFAAFVDRGFGHVLLNVDAENPTGATALYERVGMRIVKRWDLWERSPEDEAEPRH